MENVISLEQFKSDKEKEISVVNTPLTIEEMLKDTINIEIIINETSKLLEEGNLIAVEHPMGIGPLSYILMKIDPNIRYVVPEEIITRNLKSLILLKPVYKEESKPVRISDSIRLNNSFMRFLVDNNKATINENGKLKISDNVDYEL